MSARILILDSVAANRVVLKAKLTNAHYCIDVCSTTSEARGAIFQHQPDLILLNMADRDEDQRGFCQSLRAAPETAPIAIIAVGTADTAAARFAALDAGADDVLPHPINDSLLLARIRSLLRVRSASQELSLRETTSRALGFDEPRVPFSRPANVLLISGGPFLSGSYTETLAKAASKEPDIIPLVSALSNEAAQQKTDLLVIDATDPTADQSITFAMVAELRARKATRVAAQLVIVPKACPAIAAMFLDLGADDVAFSDITASELGLRAKALLHRKFQHDRLRAKVRSGLNAAVTDPLTGLFNRRYVDPHLKRLEAQSLSTGCDYAVMMLDIDHFKSINDMFGHAAGDQILIQIADRLRENLRAIDLVARIGGEEFLIAMPRTSARQAKLAADRLRRKVNSSQFDIGAGLDPVSVTLSVGVAVSNANAAQQQPVAALCRSADQALYVAKSAGRNQVAMGISAA